MVVKGVLTGLRAWLVQRVTAIIVLLLLLLFFVRLGRQPFETYEAWSTWIQDPKVSIAVALFFGALLLHAWVGLRDIVVDYVRPAWLRLLIHSAVVIGYSGIAFWIVRILLR